MELGYPKIFLANNYIDTEHMIYVFSWLIVTVIYWCQLTKLIQCVKVIVGDLGSNPIHINICTSSTPSKKVS